MTDTSKLALREVVRAFDQAMRAKGHTPREYDGELELDSQDGYHSVAFCTSCGWSTCVWCHPDTDDILECNA